MNPLISIIIPTYNCAKFLPETLGGVLNQSYQNFEVIVVDDKSTDSTPKLFEETGIFNNPKIKYIRLDKNMGGPAGPRNRGLELATGEYICFLDSDDVWQTDKLEVQLKKMLEGNYEFSSTRRRVFTNKTNMTPMESAEEIPLTYSSLLKKNIIFTSSVMVKATLIKDLTFNTSKERVAVEDYEMWLTILKLHKPKAAVFGDYSLHYRVHANGISRAKLKMAKKVWKLLSSEKFNINPVEKTYYFTTYMWHSTLNKIVE